MPQMEPEIRAMLRGKNGSKLEDMDKKGGE